MYIYISGLRPSAASLISAWYRSAKTFELVLNNPTEEDKEQWIKILTNEEIVKRAVVGLEYGEEKKTPHFQGRVTFNTNKRVGAIKKLLGSSRIHVEITRAKNDWSYLYKGDVFIDQNFGAQGTRNDLNAVAEAVRDGASLTEIADRFPVQFIKFNSGIKKLIDELGRNQDVTAKYGPDDFNIPQLDTEIHKCWVVTGPSGVGKTQWALSHFTKPLFVRHMDDLQQLRPTNDGIVFDDMSFTHLPRTAQIHLLDSEVGSSIHTRYITAWIPAGMARIFTTNEPGGRIFNLDDPAIARRIRISEQPSQLWNSPGPEFIPGTPEHELEEM